MTEMDLNVDTPLDINIEEEKPKKKIRWGRGVLIFLAILFVMAVVVGVALGEITTYQCKSKCNTEGAITQIRVQNGKWNLKDTCVCYG